jgi:drug/metabolite transporter (DMT)-like permease
MGQAPDQQFEIAQDKNVFSGPLVLQLGNFFFGVLPICVSAANKAGWTTGSVVVARFTITCLCVLLAARVTRQSLRTSNVRLLLLRGFLGGSAVLFYFAAVEQTGAAMGTLLNNTHSIWASALAVLFLGERPSRGFWAILALAIAGIWLVINPSFDRFSWGELLGLLSGILAGGAILCVKQLRQTDNALTILFSFAVSGLLCGIPLAVYSWRGVPGTADFVTGGWLALLGVGISSFVAQFLFTQGYKNTSVQLGSVLTLTTPVLASILGWLFLDERLGLRFVAGASLTLAACALIGLKPVTTQRLDRTHN